MVAHFTCLPRIDLLVAMVTALLEGNSKLLPVNSLFAWHVRPPDLLPPPG